MCGAEKDVAVDDDAELGDDADDATDATGALADRLEEEVLAELTSRPRPRPRPRRPRPRPRSTTDGSNDTSVEVAALMEGVVAGDADDAGAVVPLADALDEGVLAAEVQAAAAARSALHFWLL